MVYDGDNGYGDDDDDFSGTIWLWLTVCHGKIHHAINR